MGVCHLCFGNRCQIDLCVADVHVWCFETRGHIWNRKWLPQDPHYLLTIHHAVMTFQGLVERSHWESKYLFMLKPGGWSLLCATAIAIGWMMNWTLYKRMDVWWELHWRRYMFIVFDLQEANVCEYVRKDAWNSYQKCMQPVPGWQHEDIGQRIACKPEWSESSGTGTWYPLPYKQKRLMTMWNVNTAITLPVNGCEMWKQTLSEDLNGFLLHDAIVGY